MQKLALARESAGRKPRLCILAKSLQQKPNICGRAFPQPWGVLPLLLVPYSHFPLQRKNRQHVLPAVAKKWDMTMLPTQLWWIAASVWHFSCTFVMLDISTFDLCTRDWAFCFLLLNLCLGCLSIVLFFFHTSRCVMALVTHWASATQLVVKCVKKLLWLFAQRYIFHVPVIDYRPFCFKYFETNMLMHVTRHCLRLFKQLIRFYFLITIPNLQL